MDTINETKITANDLPIHPEHYMRLWREGMYSNAEIMSFLLNDLAEVQIEMFKAETKAADERWNRITKPAPIAPIELIKPHDVYNYSRADEIAECWNVGDDLYDALWVKVVPHQKDIPNREDSGPADHVGFECLAKHWHRLSEREQLELNRIAAFRS